MLPDYRVFSWSRLANGAARLASRLHSREDESGGKDENPTRSERVELLSEGWLTCREDRIVGRQVHGSAPGGERVSSRREGTPGEHVLEREETCRS